MFGNNNGRSESDEPPEDLTELVMRKDGENIVIWAVVDGYQIFHAEPSIKMAKGPIDAAIKTWIGRAFGDVLSDNSDDKESGGFM